MDAEEQPALLAAEDVAGQATQTLATVRDMRQLAKPVSSVEDIAKQIPDLFASIEAFRQDPVNLNSDRQSPSLLNEARRQGRRILKRLENWEATLNARAKSLHEGMQELDRLTDTWEQAGERATAEEWPDAVITQIAPLVAEIEIVKQELRQRQEEALTLQNRVTEQEVIVSELLELNNEALEASRERILSPNLPPLWKLGTGKELYLSFSEIFGQSWQRIQAGLVEFVTHFQSRIQIHIFCLLVLTGLIFLLHRRARQIGEEDEKTQAVTSVLARPFAAAFILTAIFDDIFYPTAPVVINDLLGIIVLPAAARLVPCLVPQSLRRPLYVLLVLSLVSILSDLLVGYGFFRRIFLLGMTIYILVGVQWLNRRLRIRSLVAWPRGIDFVVGVGRVVFVIVLVANLGGYVALAEVILYGTITAGYAAFIALASVRIIEAALMVALRTRLAQSLASIRFNTDAVRGRVNRFVSIAAVIAWFAAVLEFFHVRDQVFTWLASWLDQRWQVGTLQISVASILLFFVVIWVTLLVSRVARNLLDQDILPRTNLSRGEADTVSMLVNYTVLGLGILVALGAAGIRMEQFALIAGALGVGIGFGLQTIVSNFISGLILIFERPIKIGDTVEVGQLLGRVRRIGIRSSTVYTFDGAEVIVPNNDLITGQVVNWTLSDQVRRIEVKVGVTYGTDPNRVLELLVGVAREHEKTLQNPAPQALFLGFGDSSLNFSLRFWTADYANWLQTASEVTVAVNSALKEAGIEIPFPQRDLHVRSIDPPMGQTLWPLAADEENLEKEGSANSAGPVSSAETDKPDK